jgi:hypothetical protein
MSRRTGRTASRSVRVPQARPLRVSRGTWS